MLIIMMIETEEERVSFQSLYEETYRKLLHVADTILHNRYDSEEVVGDVYVKWADGYSRYKEKTTQEMLRLGIVMTRNLCVDRIRERKRHPDIPVEEEFMAAGASEEDADPLDQILTQERTEELVEAMRSLAARDQLLLDLRYDQGFSYQEIADELDMTVNNVKMRLYRAKKKLGMALTQEMEV